MAVFRRKSGRNAGRSGSNNGEGPAKRGVDIKDWAFYGRDKGETPFLIGPVVGAVTTSDARVLVEVGELMGVTMAAFVDSDVVCFVEKDVVAKTPTIFKLGGFPPGTQVRVIVSAKGQTREAHFMTSSNKQQWKIAAVSCNCHKHAEKLQLWNKLSMAIGEVDCVLHLGDQIYADSDIATRESTEPFPSAWDESNKLLARLTGDQWPKYNEEILELYRNTYRITWNTPYVAKVLASAANYMICDDHEFVDDLGDEAVHHTPSTVEFYVARLAYQVYCEYQRQLLEDTDVTDVSMKPYYGITLSPRIGLFMTENRVVRSLHRNMAEDREEDWKNRTFLGPPQWDRITDAFENDFDNCDVVLFAAPTPLVFLSNRGTQIAQTQIDDARGTWGHPDFKEEQKTLCSMLTKWQNAKDNRAIVTLAGDVHMGGFTNSWHNNSKLPLHQMTSSAIGNLPEGGLLSVLKQGLVRNTMHADAKLFSFMVKHHGWIVGPNFGMVDIFLPNKRRRPDITLTLVPHEGYRKLCNLELGDSSIVVKNHEHTETSKNAHVTAETMCPGQKKKDSMLSSSMKTLTAMLPTSKAPSK